MLTKARSTVCMLHLVWLALAASAFAVIPITVTDLKNRSIEIEVVAVTGDSVTFRRTGNDREYTLPIANFEENSRRLIRKQAKLLPAPLPKIEAAVSIGKRRKKGNSYYMVKQQITCSIKLTNLDPNKAVPPVSGQIVFIGQNRRTSDVYKVLSTQGFEATLEKSGSVSKTMKSFTTSYDSDNKGYGNVGGFQYFGYILALKDKEGKIFYDQTSSGSMRQTLKDRRGLLEQVIGYPKGQVLTDKLEAPEADAAVD